MSSPAAPESSQSREELARLQAELASRASTVHFAHAGVSTMASLILMGGTGKMLLDEGKFRYFTAFTGLLAVGLVGYALFNYFKGRARYLEESVQYERMMALRRELELDNPDALLPER